MSTLSRRVPSITFCGVSISRGPTAPRRFQVVDVPALVVGGSNRIISRLVNCRSTSRLGRILGRCLWGGGRHSVGLVVDSTFVFKRPTFCSRDNNPFRGRLRGLIRELTFRFRWVRPILSFPVRCQARSRFRRRFQHDYIYTQLPQLRWQRWTRVPILKQRGRPLRGGEFPLCRLPVTPRQ